MKPHKAKKKGERDEETQSSGRSRAKKEKQRGSKKKSWEENSRMPDSTSKRRFGSIAIVYEVEKGRRLRLTGR